MENLGRGVVAMRTSSTQVYVGWRLLGLDASGIAFNVYRSANGGTAVKLNSTAITNSTNYVDATANLTQSNAYHVRPVIGGVEQAASVAYTLPANAPTQNYLRVALQQPPGGTNDLDGHSFTYSPNDCSVGDLDGDGEYEIVVKWYPSDAQDNANDGYTAPTILDAYTLNGTRLWRINLGRNIRSGAHYTQFQVFDLDGDGKAELVCKTADGTVSGTGQLIGSASADYRQKTGRVGRVLAGPEFLTVFNGQTGAILSTVNYNPARGTVSDWGDTYGNRVDRLLACVAYLDGERPSVVMCRGYYTRAVLAAYDWRNGQLTQRWVFDTGFTGGSLGAYRGQGAHSLTVGDVDGDGRQEIIYGACTIDDNGTGKYSTQLGHGDALHLSDMNPGRPGLEVYMVHESPTTYGTTGSELHDANTGSILLGVSGDGADVGRGCAGDINPNFAGYEVWASRGGMYSASGTLITNNKPAVNFMCYWDADLSREILDGTTISKWNATNHSASSILSPSGVASNNGTKATPNLSADIFGDWREEVIWRETGNDALRIYTTTDVTTNRIYTLMHDAQYRVAIAWQNTAYNQPPHPGFFLGTGMAAAPTPNITYVGGTPPVNNPPTVSITSPSNGATFTAGANITINATAADSDGTVSSVQFFQGSTSLGTDTSSPYSVTWNNVAAGTYSVTARATDNSGAQTTSSPVSITVNPGGGGGATTLQAEAATIGGGATIESNNAGFNGTGFVNFPATGGFIQFSNVNGGGGGSATLAIRYALGATSARSGLLIINGASQGITFQPSGAWTTYTTQSSSISLNSGSANTIRLESNGQDLANIDEITITVSASNTPPTVSITSPSNGATFTAGANITINATAADSDGTVSSVQFFQGSTSLGTDTSSPYSVTWNSVPAGTYSLTARATDNGGAQTTSSPVSITVNASSTPDTYQAENATVAGGATIESNNAGFNGTGFVNFPANGGTLTFSNVDGNGGGAKILVIRYALGATAARTGNIVVNGSTASITFQPTGAWTTYTTMTFNLTLNNNSSNTIQIASTGSDLGNVDEITVP